MAQQYNDACEALEDPELREKFAREQRNFMKELVEAANKNPTRRPHELIPVEKSDG